MPSQVTFSAPEARLQLGFEISQCPAPGAHSPSKSGKTSKVIAIDPAGPPSTTHSFSDLCARRVRTVIEPYDIGACPAHAGVGVSRKAAGAAAREAAYCDRRGAFFSDSARVSRFGAHPRAPVSVRGGRSRHRAVLYIPRSECGPHSVPRRGVGGRPERLQKRHFHCSCVYSAEES